MLAELHAWVPTIVNLLVLIVALTAAWTKISVKLDTLRDHVTKLQQITYVTPGSQQRLITLLDCVRVHSECWEKLHDRFVDLENRLRDLQTEVRIHKNGSRHVDLAQTGSGGRPATGSG